MLPVLLSSSRSRLPTRPFPLHFLRPSPPLLSLFCPLPLSHRYRCCRTNRSLRLLIYAALAVEGTQPNTTGSGGGRPSGGKRESRVEGGHDWPPPPLPSLDGSWGTLGPRWWVRVGSADSLPPSPTPNYDFPRSGVWLFLVFGLACIGRPLYFVRPFSRIMQHLRP